jgi:hypothetical protein
MRFTKVLIVVVVLGLLGGGFYFYSMKTKKIASVPTTVNPPVQNENVVDAPNAAAGSTMQTTDEWKTYSNQNSKVSFKYPTSAGMPGGDTATEKTSATGTQVLVKTPGMDFEFIIQPMKPGIAKYYGESKFVENYRADGIVWDVSESSGICDQKNNCGQPFIAFQTVKNNIQYVFVFSNETKVNEVEQTVVSTFKFSTATTTNPDVQGAASPTLNPDTQQAIQAVLAKKYKKSLSEVKVTVNKEVPGFAAGTVMFGTGGPGEAGAWLAVLSNGWDVVWDGNGNVDCNKMRQDYGFPDTILKPNFCN